MEKPNTKQESNKDEVVESSSLVSNGCVDVHGKIADKQKTGGWKASPFIIVNEVAERLAFFAIQVNMISFLVTQMHEPLPTAASHVTAWIGSAFMFTILGAFLADAYLGRFKTIILFSTVYALGMALLTVSASAESLHPPPCTAQPCKLEPASKGQNTFLYGSLFLIALGTGGIKPCVSSFGADQFDEEDQNEVVQKSAFFNWFFFAINMGAFIGITLLVYIQVKQGWAWGFGIPAAAMVFSIFVLLVGVPFYRFQKPMGSPFTRFFQVIVASIRNHLRGVPKVDEGDLYEVKTAHSDILGARKLLHTPQCRFLDKAAFITNPDDAGNRWRVCTVTQVEELKSMIRMLPVWGATIALSVSFSQLSTFFISQATIMDRRLGNFVIPAASIPVFSAINAIVLVPLYEKCMVPILRKLTGHHRGLTSLQRMGVGLFVSIIGMTSAALVESKRRNHSNPSTMSAFWLFPQFFVMGSAEFFTYVGQLEFFYDEATDGTRSISSAMFLCEIGIGNWISSALVKIVGAATGGEHNGLLRNDLNKSKLDYFYWILTAINGVNFLVYLFVAWRYKGRGEAADVRDKISIELNRDTEPNKGKDQ